MQQRIMQGAPGKLTVTLTDQDGDPVAATGVLTVGVTKADGTQVLAAGTATDAGDTDGIYTVSLTAAQTAQLNLLTATWTDAGSGRVVTTKHEIVGGFFFSLADVRASNDSLLQDSSKYPNALVLATRQEVEVEAEEICDVAFVRRYARVTLDGSASADLALPYNRIRAVRSIRTYSVVGGTEYTAFSDAQLAGLSFDPAGGTRIWRTDLDFFAEGRANIVVEFEHGYDEPPADVRRAALTRLRSRLNFEKGAANDRATSFTAENGQTYKLSTAEAYRTGIPEVDAAYARYSYRDTSSPDGSGGASRPASRALTLDPQRNSIFHAHGTVR